MSAAFSSGENKGNAVPLVPDAHGIAAAWVEPLADFRLTADCAWTSSQRQGGDFDNTLREIDGYGLFGLRADLKLKKRFGLFLKVENIFDQTYASSAYNGGWYPGCGRAFYGGVTLAF